MIDRKIFGLLLLVGLILIGCSTKDYFGELSEKEILQFNLEGQTGNTIFKNDTLINITVSEEVYLLNLSNLSATNIKVSDYATVSPTVGEKQDFSKPVAYTVTAEDGSKKTYYVIVQQRGGTGEIQLPNSSFENWHDAEFGTTQYIDIGVDKDTKTWATGNQGAAFAIGLGAEAELPSQPYERSQDEIAAKLTTQDMGALAAAFGGKGIAAGNLFTGRFEIGNVTNAHPVFGTPYTETPIAFKIDYKYSPAEGLLNGKRRPVEGKDAADMYVILEKREGNKAIRLGSGWLRVTEAQEEWTTEVIDIKYAKNGQAPEEVSEHARYVLKYGHDGDTSVSDPGLMPEATWGDISKDKPTHIIAVFSSSYLGDYFIGAPGSTLWVDNFELIY